MPPKKHPSEALSFRLSGPLLDLLTKEAEARGKSRDLCAKELVVAALQDETSREQLHRLNEVRDEVKQLRLQVATMLAELWENRAREFSRDDARQFIARHGG